MVVYAPFGLVGTVSIAAGLLSCLYFVRQKQLIMINICHLCIGITQYAESEVGSGSISRANGILITTNSLRSVTHIRVGTAQKIMGKYAFVNRAVAVEIMDKYLAKGIGSELIAGLVHSVLPM